MIKKPTEFKINNTDRTIVLYPAGYLARAIQRDIQTVALWRKSGWLPKAEKEIRGQPLYSDAYIQAAVETLNRTGVKRGRKIDGTLFRQIFTEEYKKQVISKMKGGVKNASVSDDKNSN